MTTAKNIRAISVYDFTEKPETIHPITWDIFRRFEYDGEFTTRARCKFTAELEDGKIEILVSNIAVDNFLHLDICYTDENGYCWSIYNPSVVRADFASSRLINPSFQCRDFTAENIDAAISEVLEMHAKGVETYDFKGDMSDFLDQVSSINRKYIESHPGCRTFRI